MDLWSESTFLSRSAQLVNLASTAEDIQLVAKYLAKWSGVTAQRFPSSTAGAVDDLYLEKTGTGQLRILLIGHLDTVYRPQDQIIWQTDDDKIVGSGTYDIRVGDLMAAELLGLSWDTSQYATLAVRFTADEETRRSALYNVGEWHAVLGFEGADPDTKPHAIVKRAGAFGWTLTAQALGGHSGITE